MSLVSKIPQKIKEANTNVFQMHKATGITRQTLTRIKEGHIPRHDILLALCEFFDCQLSDLFVYEVDDE